jgi:hypothetical protein
MQNSTLNTKLTKNYLVNLLNELSTIYKNTQEERKKLAQWEEDQEFTILGVMELLTTEIRGYSFQIIDNKLSLTDEKNMVQHLQELNLFNIPYVNQWYFADDFNYPQLKNYLEKLNYVRLLILEYIL